MGMDSYYFPQVITDSNGEEQLLFATIISYYLPEVITASQRDEQLLLVTSNYCLSRGWTVTICNK